MIGCSNPSAANYTPGATQDNLSCLYLKKVEGICYLFRDIQDGIDESFTASYSHLVEDWVFFHGYIPDGYIQTRDKLFTLKDNELYQHNSGPYGKFYGATPESFFVDIVVSEQKESILSALQWVTEVLDPQEKDKEHKTFTHITVWNNYQCTGRIALSDVFLDLQNVSNRKSKGAWNFNDIRSVVVNNEESFLKTIFEDFTVDPTKINVNLPWYEKQLMMDDHFIVRFEYDNQEDLNIILHQSGALLDKTM
jgi:hypothetical protein